MSGLKSLLFTLSGLLESYRGAATHKPAPQSPAVWPSNAINRHHTRWRISVSKGDNQIKVPSRWRPIRWPRRTAVPVKTQNELGSWYWRAARRYNVKACTSRISSELVKFALRGALLAAEWYLRNSMSLLSPLIVWRSSGDIDWIADKQRANIRASHALKCSSIAYVRQVTNAHLNPYGSCMKQCVVPSYPLPICQ